MNNKGKEILDEFLKEDSEYSLRYSFNGDIIRDRDLFKDYLKELIKEIERLNNIINELEKYCETRLSIFGQMTDEQREEQLDRYKIYDIFLSRIKELKGDSSNE